MLGGVLVLIILLILGVLLLVEAFKIPDGPQDVLDPKRMLVSGVGLILFSLVVTYFLVRMFRTNGKTKPKRRTTNRKAPTRRKTRV